MPPQFDQRLKGHQGYGLIQLFTGNGKGKTTAALGEAMRAYGAGKKVGIIFFDKGGEHYSERKTLTQLSIEYLATGRDRIEANGRFDFSITDLDRAEAEKGLVEWQRMMEEKYDLIILDEINSTTSLGIIDLKKVLIILKNKPPQTELILTGRNAPPEFIDQAHLITSMELKKHYFYSGVSAREGIDY